MKETQENDLFNCAQSTLNKKRLTKRLHDRYEALSKEREYIHNKVSTNYNNFNRKEMQELDDTIFNFLIEWAKNNDEFCSLLHDALWRERIAIVLLHPKASDQHRTRVSLLEGITDKLFATSIYR